LISAGQHCEVEISQVYPSAEVAWEYYNGSDWRGLDILKDSTLALMQSGSIYFKGPGNIKASKQGESQTQDFYWIRCRLKKPGYEVPPRIDSILLNTVSASAAVTQAGEILGSSDGTPNQSFTLLNTPALAGTLVLQVDEGEGMKTWQEVDDLASSTREDEHYMLNRLTGEIRFGDGTHGRIPLPEPGGNNIMALEYRYGGGEKGNVGSNKITSLETSVPGVEAVTNFRPAFGGKDEETAAAAKKRGPMELKTRQRAVTAEDFEFLARETPGVRVRRAKALPLFHPDFPNCKIPGAVTVIIVPESKDPKPLPSEGMLETVCKHLNQHRLLTNEVYVIPPKYVKIKVEAEVIAKPEADSNSVKRELAKNLARYFHPLTGGLTDDGWPFGGDIFFSDVYKEILNTKGVERIESVFLYKENQKQEECTNIQVPGDCLVYSRENEHELDVHYERD
jgi:predicted phage baseplate assembly protein